MTAAATDRRPGAASFTPAVLESGTRREVGGEPSRAAVRVLAFATQGVGSHDDARLATLLGEVEHERFAFDASAKPRSFAALVRRLLAAGPELVVMEGTGIAGGTALLLARWARGIEYVVSSGDAVAPFIRLRHPVLAPVAAVYERLLCRFASGFIGWTPYLAGRALTFGAARAITAAGWAPFQMNAAQRAERRARTRARLGIPSDALVVGIVGSLIWAPRVGYCYGQELVAAISLTSRRDVRVLIVGDGDGRAHLERLAGEDLGRRVLLTGRVPRDEVPDYLAAMDVASLPQSVDAVGAFRYTTKLSEYVGAGLPIVATQIPLAYDFDDGWLWRLRGDSPWDRVFVRALATWLEGLRAAEVAVKASAVPVAPREFDVARQRAVTTAFIADLLEARARRTGKELP